MYRHISKLLVLFGLFVLLTPVISMAQETPITHLFSVSWDAQVELSLDLSVTTDEGVYCNLSQITPGDECDLILNQLGSPQLSWADGPQSASVEWRELAGYSNYTVCVSRTIFDTGPDVFATHLTIRGYINTQLTQVYMVPFTNGMPYCFGPTVHEDEVLSQEFVVDVASAIPPQTTFVGDSDLTVRLIQPADYNLSLLVDVTQPSSTTPSFAISTTVDAAQEVPDWASAKDAMLVHEDFAGFYNLTFFVSYVSPTAASTDNGATVPFAVVVYDQGQLSAIYFGQVTGVNQIWLASYPAEPVAVQDYPVYDPIVQIVTALANQTAG